MWVFTTIYLIIVFFILVNSNMKGSLTHILDGILGFFIVLITIIIFYKFGWKIGLYNILGGFIFGGIIIPITNRVSSLFLSEK